MKVAFEPLPREFVSETTLYDYKDPMSDAVSKVSRLGAVVVLKDGSYYGIVDDRSIASKGTTKISTKFPVGKFAKQVPALGPDTDIKQAIQVFYHAASKAAPFIENGRVKGIIKRTDILKSILSLHLLSAYTAKDAMSTPVLAIDQEESLAKAKVSMQSNNVNRLVVIDKGRMVGILTYRNIIESGMGLKTRDTELAPSEHHKGQVRATVGEVCNRDVYSVEQDYGIDGAIRQFISNGMSSLIVTKRGKPVGVLSIRDVLETVVKDSNVQRRNIVLSGLDQSTREYEDDIMVALESFAEKADKLSGTKVSYIALNVKRIKARSYELKARVVTEHGGAVSMYSSGFTLEKTLKELLSKLYKGIETRNDIVITTRKM